MRISPAVAVAALAFGAPAARAQLFDKSAFFGSGLGSDTLQGAAPYGNPILDNRVYVHGFFDQLEGRIGDGTYLRWDGQAWIGNDYNKVWLKSEGRYNPGNRGRMEDGDHELLYDRSVSRYFDVQGRRARRSRQQHDPHLGGARRPGPRDRVLERRSHGLQPATMATTRCEPTRRMIYI